jgi:hypothetical protein
MYGETEMTGKQIAEVYLNEFARRVRGKYKKFSAWLASR